jgi:triosephosphate isomerase (TIM)
MTLGEPRLLVAGNWKMNLLRSEAATLCRELRAGLAERDAAARAEVVVFPSFPLLPLVALELAGCAVEVGGQDLHPAARGAHTGDVAGPQPVDAGCRWVICGHSERRRDHGESDDLVGRKAVAAASHGLTPVLCVGETQAERASGETLAVLERQVRAGLAPYPSPSAVAPRPVLAYEPVWAIGTGLTASPEIVQEAHGFLRRIVAEVHGESAASTSILYGGSVTPANAPALIEQPDVNGFLVGGASLDPRQFLAIIACSG